MKYLILFLLCLPVGLSAQSALVDTWTAEIPDREGNIIPLHLTISDDGTYAVDFGADGKVEITGTYSTDGNLITVQDDEGQECTGVGVYNYEITGSTLTMESKSDECPERAGPEGVMVFQRK